MASGKPLLAFYGATGGCILYTLSLALKNGYECTALARTPSKLTDLLRKRDVPQATIDSQLHITQGDVRDVATVKKALTLPTRPADIIISGIGATSLSELSSSSLNLCETFARNTLTALEELRAEGGLPRKPLLVALSTTGITEGQSRRDLPILMMPLYKLMLVNPHRDKTVMGNVIEEHMAQGVDNSAIRGYILPRPSFLTNGTAQGGARVRTGLEDRPAVGYTISREDVGLWLFENVVEGKNTERYIGHKPTITY